MLAHEQELLDSFKPFASAIANIFQSLKILVLVAITVILFMNLFTWTLFQYLQVQLSSPSGICVATSSSHPQTYPPSSGARSTEDRLSYSVVAYQPANTHECSEPEQLQFTELNPSNVSQTSCRSVTSHFKTRGRLGDVGYSETNV